MILLDLAPRARVFIRFLTFGGRLFIISVISREARVEEDGSKDEDGSVIG